MKNVEAPEDNIHAGIKYMRYVVDEYFDEPGIDDVNRHLFAFAAYNAGPNRIARLRKLAPEYGVDPNMWFKNVERIVASKVGNTSTTSTPASSSFTVSASRPTAIGMPSGISVSKSRG